MTPYAPFLAQLCRRGRRETNEDAVVAVRLDDGRELLAVADGMGGHVGGEIASTTALRTVLAELSAGADLVAAVEAANTAIVDLARSDRALTGMGTTLVALLQTGKSYEVVNVGDSRAYFVSMSGIHQITQDHSFVHEAIQSGQMTPEAALRSPWRNALTRSLGSELRVQVDRFGPFSGNARPPFALLLCSDGLHKTLSAGAIQEVVLSASSAQAAVEALVTRALAEGSDDNISVVIRDSGIFEKQKVQPLGRVPDPGPRAELATRDIVIYPDTLRGRPAFPPAPAKATLSSPVFWASPPPARRSSWNRRRRAGKRWDVDRVLMALSGSALLLWLAVLFLDL